MRPEITKTFVLKENFTKTKYFVKINSEFGKNDFYSLLAIDLRIEGGFKSLEYSSKKHPVISGVAEDTLFISFVVFFWLLLLKSQTNGKKETKSLFLLVPTPTP